MEDTEQTFDLEKQKVEQHTNYDQSNDTATLLPAKKKPPKRDIRTLNYAFGEPRMADAAKEAQEWFDSLSIAEEEEKNPARKIFPPGPKYRSGTANQSLQMIDRLQRCEENQEPYSFPKNRIMRAERNASADIHAGLHEEDNCNRPQNLWKGGRRSAAGNNSSSVYAILHPQAITG